MERRVISTKMQEEDIKIENLIQVVLGLTDTLIDELKKDIVAYMDEMYPDKNITFKVESRRAKKTYPKNSMEINCDLGEAILDAFPDMECGAICGGQKLYDYYIAIE